MALSNWSDVNLDSVADIIDGDRGINYPTQHEFSSYGDCLFLNAGNVTQLGFNFTNCSFVTKEKDASLRKGKLRRQDIVLTTRGTVGNVAYYDRSIPFDNIRINSGMVIFRPEANKIDPLFLYIFLRSKVFGDQVRGLTTGSAQPQIPIRDIRRIYLPLPDMNSQKAIAAILGALDDKIELNRRMNATLEAMARALFKSWFVDFDPVRAKSEGRQPFGMGSKTAALFPSSLVPSELGDIPEGWAVNQIGNAVTAVGGSTPSTENPEYWISGHHAWVTPKDLSALKSPVLFSTERRITDAGVRVISSGLLPSGTVLMSSRAPIGYIAIAETPVAINQGFIAITCDKTLPNLYVWQWLQTNLDMIKSHANGSTFQEISKGSFRPLPCIVPEARVLKKFQTIVLPVWQKLVANEKERLGLEKTRDYLLPKLISGDIRIPDAEKFVETV